MKKLLRIAGVALLALTIGVFGCGDDDDPVAPVAPVAPPAPPPPPLVVTMAPASQTIGVGGTVVFAISVSGGVAGEAASWTCDSSDPSKATVTMTPAGCAATAVAAGGVTITAAVTKSGATVNTAAGLTITEDMAERATLFITSINDDDEVLSERVSVTLDVERGDQMLMQLSVLVDGVVAVSRTYGGGASVVAAAPEGEEGERAAQQAARAIVLSFNSEHYNTATGEPTYMNGEHTISAELMVASSDEPIKSGFHVREFGNGDAVHVTVTGLGEGVVSGKGQRWYGGPKAALEMTALPVLYSGGSAASVSVTLRAFCGADAATETSETSFTFTPECSATSNTAATDADLAGDSPVFVIADAVVATLSDDVFPLYLDFKGPEAPRFVVNPGMPAREGGWINGAVELAGQNKDTDATADAWLTYGAEDTGVGGYTAQLRYSTTTPRIVDGALAEDPSSAPTPPAVSKTDEVCFVASAVDDLGNVSKEPKAGQPCLTYEAYELRLTAFATADAGTNDDAKKEARANLLVGLRAGVDLTPPTIVFTASSSKADDNTGELRNYQVQVKDEKDGSGAHKTSPVLARLEIRNAKSKMICGDGDRTKTDLPGDESDLGVCESNSEGLTIDGALITTKGLPGLTADKDVGYYTMTAEAQDAAGNRSDPMSRVGLVDNKPPEVVFSVGGYDLKKALYPLNVFVTDNLSIREHYVSFDVASPPVTDLPTTFRIGSPVEVDAYNSDEFTKTLPATGLTLKAFRALQSTAVGGVPSAAPTAALANITVHARDQRKKQDGEEDYVSMMTTTENVGGVPSASQVYAEVSESDADEFTDAAATSFVTAGTAIETFTFDIVDTPQDYDQDDRISFEVTAAGFERDGKDEIDVADATDDRAEVKAIAFPSPFLRVDFYATNLVTGDATLGTEFRLIGSLAGTIFGKDDDVIDDSPEDGTDTERASVDRRITYTYTLGVSAAEAFKAVGGKSNYSGRVIAVGVSKVGVGLVAGGTMADHMVKISN